MHDDDHAAGVYVTRGFLVMYMVCGGKRSVIWLVLDQNFFSKYVRLVGEKAREEKGEELREYSEREERVFVWKRRNFSENANTCYQLPSCSASFFALRFSSLFLSLL